MQLLTKGIVKVNDNEYKLGGCKFIGNNLFSCSCEGGYFAELTDDKMIKVYFVRSEEVDNFLPKIFVMQVDMGVEWE